ncbi:MAG TPA: LptA/OstA family protein [Sphingomonas sp.]|nr:LptA/OstA family protein [Sphingomonas sp.]
MSLHSPAPMLIALSLALAGTEAGTGIALAQATTAPAAAPAKNSPHNSNAPIDWVANRIEVQDQQHRAVLTGAVRVVQEEMTLTADRVTANYTGSVAGSSSTPATGSGGKAPAGSNSGGPQVHRLDATGNVVVTRPTEVAHGQFGIYDLDKRLVTLIGGVTLDRTGPNPGTVRGGRLVIDLNTGHANMDGSAVGGAGSAGVGGRVSGRFTVPQHNDNQGNASAPKPASPAKPAQH